MEIEGIFYVAEVREKEEAWRKYKDAVEKGKTAGERPSRAEFLKKLHIYINVYIWRKKYCAQKLSLSTEKLDFFVCNKFQRSLQGFFLYHFTLTFKGLSPGFWGKNVILKILYAQNIIL